VARQVAVVIGVSRVPGFTPLAGVKTGVTEFSDWATAQGFQVERFVDFDGEPVRADSIVRAVRTVVDAGDAERLVVYFSGHGLAVGTWDDMWLLSEANVNPNEAINVSKSAELARQCGIPHVVFFGDACRNPPGKLQLSLQGSLVFPSVHLNQVDVQVDRFFATKSGDSAWEKVPEQVAARAFGVFSRCLMSGLRGEAGEVARPVVGGRMPYAVLAHPLREYLSRKVRLEAYREVQVDQRPDCIAESIWEPNVLSWLEPPAALPAAPAPAPPPPQSGPETGGAAEVPVPPGRPRWRGIGRPRPPAASRSAPDEDAGDDDDALLAQLDERHSVEVDALATRFAAAAGRSNFETAAGLSVVGAKLDLALVAGGDRGTFEERGAWHVRGREGRPAAAMLRLERPEGRLWAAAVILPGYVGTLTVGAGGSEQLEYLPVASAPPQRLDPSLTHQLIARASAQLRIGGFEPTEDRDMWAAVEDDLNPTLATLTAYYLVRMGRRGKVRELVSMFEDRDRVVPFDLVLLAGVDAADLRVPVAPAFPMMTQGWSLADTLPIGEDAFSAARRQLAPALWTTFRDISINLADKLVGG